MMYDNHHGVSLDNYDIEVLNEFGDDYREHLSKNTLRNIVKESAVYRVEDVSFDNYMYDDELEAHVSEKSN